jgi:RNA polymerase sigma factor (sigma-70 family)
MNIVPPSSTPASPASAQRAPWLSVVPAPQRRGDVPTSEELNAWALAVAENADRQAFAALFKHFAPRIKAYLIRCGTSDALAEELAQETMVNVWRKAATFDPSRAGLSTWIFTIARNVRADHFRRPEHRISADTEYDMEAQADTSPALEEQVFARERESRVRTALARLPEEQALVLTLSFFEERPHARIASELGIPLGTVKSRVRLAVLHLRRLLDGLDP